MTGKLVEILLVEDDRNDLELTLHVLKKSNLANRIHVVRHGAEALEFIFRTGSYANRDVNHTPGLILLDLKLPLVDGLEVLRRLKGDARTRDIPVVVITESRDERDMIESRRLGVDGYIKKPLGFEQFIETMRGVGMHWALLKKPPVMESVTSWAVSRAPIHT